ncbi:OmpH family outer membrane protein [Vibrio hippocampi]
MQAAGLGLVILTSSLFANAAEAAQKIGYINTLQVFQALPQREAVAKKLQNEFKDKSAELKAIEASAGKKIEKLKRDGELLGADEVEKLRIEIGQLQSEFKIKAQAFEKEGQRREAEEHKKMLKTIQDAVDKVAKQQGYDIVLDAQAIGYAKDEFNISEQVIKALK